MPSQWVSHSRFSGLRWASNRRSWSSNTSAVKARCLIPSPVCASRRFTVPRALSSTSTATMSCAAFSWESPESPMECSLMCRRWRTRVKQSSTLRSRRHSRAGTVAHHCPPPRVATTRLQYVLRGRRPTAGQPPTRSSRMSREVMSRTSVRSRARAIISFRRSVSAASTTSTTSRSPPTCQTRSTSAHAASSSEKPRASASTATSISTIARRLPVRVVTVNRSITPDSCIFSTRLRTVPSLVPTRSAISVYGVRAFARNSSRIARSRSSMSQQAAPVPSVFRNSKLFFEANAYWNGSVRLS